jgi:hypothetical protein
MRSPRGVVWYFLSEISFLLLLNILVRGLETFLKSPFQLRVPSENLFKIKQTLLKLYIRC